MFDLIKRDFGRYASLDGLEGHQGFFENLRVFIESPGMQAVLVYRFGSWINRTVRFRPLRKFLKLIYHLLDKLCIVLWGIHIDDGAEIGGGLYIGHFSGVLIGPVKMGVDCNLAHQVTIGRRGDGRGGVPVLGDRVWIGMGSVIFGGVHIGDGVTIGPLTVVARNLPPGALVSGNPMRLLRKNYDNSMEIYGAAVAERRKALSGVAPRPLVIKPHDDR